MNDDSRLAPQASYKESEFGPPKRPEAPDWDDYWAHRIAEKAKTKVLAYFGIVTILLTLVGIKGIDEVKRVVQEKLVMEVANKQKEAEENIQKMLKDFEKQIADNKIEVIQRKEEFYRTFVLPPQHRKPSVDTNDTVIDLSYQTGWIRNQGQEETSVGFSVAYALQAEIKRKFSKATTISARGIYVLAKQHDKWPGEDYEGTSVEGALKALTEVGGFLENHWPYDKKTNPKINADYRITGYSKISKTAQGIVSALTSGKVAIIEITVGDEFLEPLKDGRIIIKPNYRAEGGHSVAVVGYDPLRYEFKFANMWGANWGNKGFGIIRDSDLMKILVNAYVIDGLK